MDSLREPNVKSRNKAPRPLSTFEITLQVHSGLGEKEASLRNQLAAALISGKDHEEGRQTSGASQAVNRPEMDREKEHSPESETEEIQASQLKHEDSPSGADDHEVLQVDQDQNIKKNIQQTSFENGDDVAPESEVNESQESCAEVSGAKESICDESQTSAQTVKEKSQKTIESEQLHKSSSEENTADSKEVDCAISEEKPKSLDKDISLPPLTLTEIICDEQQECDEAHVHAIAQMADDLAKSVILDALLYVAKAAAETPTEEKPMKQLEVLSAGEQENESTLPSPPPADELNDLSSSLPSTSVCTTSSKSDQLPSPPASEKQEIPDNEMPSPPSSEELQILSPPAVEKTHAGELEMPIPPHCDEEAQLPSPPPGIDIQATKIPLSVQEDLPVPPLDLLPPLSAKDSLTDDFPSPPDIAPGLEVGDLPLPPSDLEQSTHDLPSPKFEDLPVPPADLINAAVSKPSSTDFAETDISDILPAPPTELVGEQEQETCEENQAVPPNEISQTANEQAEKVSDNKSAEVEGAAVSGVSTVQESISLADQATNGSDRKNEPSQSVAKSDEMPKALEQSGPPASSDQVPNTDQEMARAHVKQDKATKKCCVIM